MSDLENIKVIDGGICAVDGVNAAGTREGKYGLAVIEAKDSAAAAVFTKNKVVAAPVMHTKEMMKGGKLSLIVVNSGNANCFTGQDGIDDCNKIVEFASGLTGIPSNEIVTASTGVIGIGFFDFLFTYLQVIKLSLVEFGGICLHCIVLVFSHVV